MGSQSLLHAHNMLFFGIKTLCWVRWRIEWVVWGVVEVKFCFCVLLCIWCGRGFYGSVIALKLFQNKQQFLIPFFWSRPQSPSLYNEVWCTYAVERERERTLFTTQIDIWGCVCEGVGKHFWDFNPQFSNHILMCTAVVLGWERQASDIVLIFNSLSFHLMIIVLFPIALENRARTTLSSVRNFG